MQDKLVTIKNIDGTEIEFVAKVECKHIYGRSGGGGQGEPVPEWIKEKENIFKYDYIEILFAYCPKCGKKLIED
jgi:hypothetical protein